jgi:xanthine dehydrogenase accessory factor
MEPLDLEVLRRAAAWREAGEGVCLVTVARTFGSSPRPAGSLLAVAGGGRFAGSVSGGCAEEALVERLATAPPARPEVMDLGVDREEAARMRLPCGGGMRLVIEPVMDAASLRQAVERVERGELVARELDLEAGAARLVPAPPGAELRLEDGRFVTILGPRWRLLVIGAGDTARYLADMAAAVGFRIAVCEPRPEYRDGWPRPDLLVAGMPDDAVRSALPDARTAVVTLTHDPKLDDLALIEALASPAFYVGALGSRATSAARRQRLARHFDLGPAQLARLHAPVGLPIGSRTPPEIALAIAAELAAARNGAHLVRAEAEPGHPATAPGRLSGAP